MPSMLVSTLDQPWTASDPAAVSVSAGDDGVDGTASTRLTVAVTGATVALAPDRPLDLGTFDELRYWVRADRPADGSAQLPFLLDVGFVDQTDKTPDQHRWLVPVNRAGTWEQRRIGIEDEARSAVTRFEVRSLAEGPFVVDLDELVAVRDDPFGDAEDALVAVLDRKVDLGVEVPLTATAKKGDTELTIGLDRRFRAGNRIDVTASGQTATFDLAAATHDAAEGRTVLTLGTPDGLPRALTTNARVSIVVPAVIRDTPAPAAGTSSAGPGPDPAFVVTRSDLRADPQRTSTVMQRDSFRVDGGVQSCSVREPAQALTVDWQVAVVGSDPAQWRIVRGALFTRLFGLTFLRVNGAFCPVTVVPPPPPEPSGQEVPLVIRVGTRMEVDQRRRQALARRPDVRAAALDGPGEQPSGQPSELEGMAAP